MANGRIQRPTPPTLGSEPGGDQRKKEEEPHVEIEEGGSAIVDAPGVDTGNKGAGDGQMDPESVESMREQLARANARADAAERTARDATTKVVDAETQMLESDFNTIKTAIEREEGSKKSALQAIKAAKEAGDYDAEIDATDKLTQANINLKQLNLGKSDFERRIEIRKSGPDLSTPEGRLTKFTEGMAPRSAQWVREHRELVDDPSRTPDLEAAHYAALGKRLAAGTDAYFNFIEEELGYRQAEGVGNRQQQEEREMSRPANGGRPPAAPPSRGNAGLDGADHGRGGNESLPWGVEKLGDGRYRLSAQRHDAAMISGQTDGEYLTNLLAIHRESQTTH